MNNKELIKRVAILKANPQLAEIIPQSDIVKLLGEVVNAFSVLQDAVETNKIKGEKGNDGYTPRPGVDYVTTPQIDTAFTRALSQFQGEYAKLDQKIQDRLATVKDGEDAEVTDDLKAEIAEMCRALIELPDFETLISTTVTASPEAIRNSLELLPDGDKLAISAIEDLEAIIAELRRRPHGTTGGGVRSLRFLNDVTLEGITNGQGLAYNTALRRFEPATFGGGSGGSTYETPTGAVDGSNVTFTVSAVPQCIIYFGTTLFEGANGYSRSGLTITMPYAPTVSDQFKAVI